MYLFLPIIILLYSSDLLQAQKSFFVNNLVEKDEKFFRPFTDDIIYGDLYRNFSIDNKESKKVYVGLITNKGRQGHWTRYWDNGYKKEEGTYIDSKKEGLWIDWMENGKKYAEIFYQNGEIKHLTNCLVDNCL